MLTVALFLSLFAVSIASYHRGRDVERARALAEVHEAQIQQALALVQYAGDRVPMPPIVRAL